MADVFFLAAVNEARLGLAEGGVPIGSVLVLDGVIVGRGHNQRVQQGSVVLHAEMAALEDAGRLSVAEYRRSTLYTTLSPCAMCTGAALLYGIPRVVVGENRTFLGREDLLAQGGVAVEVLDDEACVELMTTFIATDPDLWNEDIGE
ncbi:MAG: nucleoside deaminase [Acidimicrobiales bacterium]|nr:nucleoside deaminase [Acidimicrobiales bacterium]